MNDNDIFNVSVDDVVAQPKKTYEDNDLYRPDVKKTKDSTYNSLIKFLPYIRNVRLIKQSKKYTYWLTDPQSGKSRVVDCPSSIDEESILQNVFFKLYDSKNASEKALSKNFKRKATYFSPVLILKDPQHPELEGKVMIYQYGKIIHDKIEALAKPTQDKIELGIEANNPYDIFAGKSFQLSIKIDSGFPNYDDSNFTNKVHNITVDGEKLTNTAEDRDKIMKFLNKSTPQLEKYHFKPWDENIKTFVNGCIRNTLQNSPVLEEIFKNVNTPKKSKTVTKDPFATNTNSVSDLSIDTSNAVNSTNNNVIDNTDIEELDDIDKMLSDDDELYAGLNDISDDDLSEI